MKILREAIAEEVFVAEFAVTTRNEERQAK
jgi:hypothetical protein